MPNRGGMVPAQGAQQPAAQQQHGPKAWVIWMLFGLGWASLLFFGLSVITAFPAGVQWSLWAFGWAFVLCWWAGTFMGAGFREDRKVKVRGAVSMFAFHVLPCDCKKMQQLQH
jgi:hypothetical protein